MGPGAVGHRPAHPIDSLAVDAMSKSGPDFDRLAVSYRMLEYLSFGRDLERARFSLLPHLKDCRRILVLGEGDGRCLEQLVSVTPEAEIDCLDLSPKMLALAQGRLGNSAVSIHFRQADILTTNLPSRHYDAVITCFFLDCFDPEQVHHIVTRVTASLQPGALWLWADFALPAKGPARWRAKLWIAGLYAFFHWQTGLKIRSLPPSELLLKNAGFQPKTYFDFQVGLLRCVLFRSD